MVITEEEELVKAMDIMQEQGRPIARLVMKNIVKGSDEHKGKVDNDEEEKIPDICSTNNSSS